ncbi:MAG TPA: hypothetical protein PK006_12255 [Saprospiraceae bacterium]|nr:hypothetical protein [Saprospiraceae bacterium]
MNVPSLINYTEKRLSIKPKHLRPVIRIYNTGIIYLYNSLVTKLGLNAGDRIMFSRNRETNEWYICKDITGDGLKIRMYNKRTFSTSSTVLRKELIETSLGILIDSDDKDSFYLGVDPVPSFHIKNNPHYKINFLL